MLVPRQRVAAYGLLERQANVLLVQASLHTTSGRWFLPGGGVEHGERPEAAVKREFREETGLTVRVGRLLDVLSDVMELPAENWLLHSIRVIYLVESDHEAPEPHAGDVEQVGWFTRAACRELALMPFVAAVLERT